MKKINILLGGFIAMVAVQAHAANVTWSSAVSSGDFTVGANWTGGVAPVPGDQALDTTTGTTIQVQAGDTISVANILLNAGNFNMSGGSLTTTSTTLGLQLAAANSSITISGGTVSIAGAFQISAAGATNSTINITGGTVSESNDTRIAAANSFINVSGGTWNLNKLVIGSASAAQTGDGVTVSGNAVVNQNQTFAGLNHELWIGGNNGASGFLLLKDNATWTTVGLTTGLYVGRQSGTGVFTIQDNASFSYTGAAAGTMNIGDNGTSKGTLNFNGGTVTVNGITRNIAGSTGTLNANGTTLVAATGATGAADFISNFTGAGGVDNNSVNLQAGGLKIDSNGNTLKIATSILSGTGPLTKQGTGSLELDTHNTYTGTTTVSAGTLILAASSTSASSSLIATGGTIQFAGAATLLSGAALTLDVSGDFGDTLSAASDGVTLSTLTVNSGGGTLEGDGTTNVTYTFGSTGSVFNGFLTLNNWDSVNDKLVFADTLTGTQLNDIILAGMIATGQDVNNAVVFAVPEPSELALLGLSGVLLFGMLRFRKVRAIA